MLSFIRTVITNTPASEEVYSQIVYLNQTSQNTVCFESLLCASGFVGIISASRNLIEFVTRGLKDSCREQFCVATGKTIHKVVLSTKRYTQLAGCSLLVKDFVIFF